MCRTQATKEEGHECQTLSFSNSETSWVPITPMHVYVVSHVCSCMHLDVHDRTQKPACRRTYNWTDTHITPKYKQANKSAWVCVNMSAHTHRKHGVAAAVVTSQTLTHLLSRVFDETGAFIVLTCTSEGKKFTYQQLMGVLQ